MTRSDAHLRAGTPFVSRFLSGLRRPKRLILGLSSGSHAEYMCVEAGEYRPIIDRTYPLEDAAEAHGYVDTQQKVGNVVLTLNAGASRDT